MASPSTVSQNRSSDRFSARYSERLTAELLILCDDDVVTLPCDLADISVSGCAVRVKLDEPREMSVAVLRMRDETGEIDIEVAGRMCWQQQTSVGTNTYGFRYRREIDASLIDRMVDEGLVTRRQEQRTSYGQSIAVRRAHGKPTVGFATLEDYSTTGVRIQCDQVLDIPERVLITTSSGVSGNVETLWVKQVEGGYQCGCVFRNLASARAINDSLANA